MKRASEAFSKTHGEDWSGKLVAVPPELQEVAKAFASLQQERHEADLQQRPDLVPK